MSRPASKAPTDGELAILKVLWSTGPAELGQICSVLRRDRQVASTTVATMLKVMLNKGLVVREDGPRAYLWSAHETKQVTSKGLLSDMLDRVFDGSARRMVGNLLELGKLSPKEREEIRRLLEETKTES